MNHTTACRLTIRTLAFAASIAWCSADDIYVDEFDGNSGGLPGGWTLNPNSDIRPETSVTEGTDSVAITDFRGGPGGGGSPTMIDSPKFETFPPGSTETVLDVNIAGASFTGASSPEISFLFGSAAHSLRIKLSQVSDQVEIYLFSQGGSVSTPISGSPFAFPYDGGAVRMVITLDTDSFRVTSSLNSFDSGDLTFAGFGVSEFDDVTDLGAMAQFTLISEAADGDGTATIEYDRVSYATDTTYTPPGNNPDTSARRAFLTKQLKKTQKQLKAALRGQKISKAKKLKTKVKKLKKLLAQL